MFIVSILDMQFEPKYYGPFSTHIEADTFIAKLPARYGWELLDLQSPESFQFINR